MYVMQNEAKEPFVLWREIENESEWNDSIVLVFFVIIIDIFFERNEKLQTNTHLQCNCKHGWIRHFNETQINYKIKANKGPLQIELLTSFIFQQNNSYGFMFPWTLGFWREKYRKMAQICPKVEWKLFFTAHTHNKYRIFCHPIQRNFSLVFYVFDFFFDLIQTNKTKLYAHTQSAF